MVVSRVRSNHRVRQTGGIYRGKVAENAEVSEHLSLSSIINSIFEALRRSVSEEQYEFKV